MRTPAVRLTPLAVCACLTLAAASGCGMSQHAAESAVIELESAWNAIELTATNYAPARAESLTVAIHRVNQALDRGEFGSALEATRALRDSVNELSRDLPSLQADLETQWTSMRKIVPATLDSLDRDLARESGQVNSAQPSDLRAARHEADLLRSQWLEAEANARSDHVAEAVTIGDQVRRRAVQLMAGSRP